MDEICPKTVAAHEDRCAENIENPLLKKITKENEIKQPELDSNTDFLNDPEVTLVPKIINKPTLQLTPIAINPLTPPIILSSIEDNNIVKVQVIIIMEKFFIF
jgi:hypothetical protein